MFNFFKRKPKEEAIQKHLKEVDKMNIRIIVKEAELGGGYV